MAENVGHIIQIAGPAVDVQFSEKALPPIYSALRVTSDGFAVPQPINVILEVEQQLGEGRVRCVAMEPTEGMGRGMKAFDLGGPITVPVGRGTLGRVLNVIGEPVDKLGPVPYEKRMPIHREAPAFDEQSTEMEMFETGVKVIDLIQPFLKASFASFLSDAVFWIASSLSMDESEFWPKKSVEPINATKKRCRTWNLSISATRSTSIRTDEWR